MATQAPSPAGEPDAVSREMLDRWRAQATEADASLRAAGEVHDNAIASGDGHAVRIAREGVEAAAQMSGHVHAAADALAARLAALEGVPA